MNRIIRLTLRFCSLLLVTLLAMMQSNIAVAQSASCPQLFSTLKALNQNRDFRSLQSNATNARNLSSELGKAESVFVRQGCQQQLNAGARLSRDCRTIARKIIQGRNTYNTLSAKVNTGQAVMQQREMTLQQIARFGCKVGSRATVNNSTRSSRGNLFDRLFGGGDDILDDGFYFDGYRGLPTLRTVCVRTCDGYFWPVSFSTISDYLSDDSAQCQSQCGGADVELFYYHNPGENPEDMVNLNGARYSALPNAFRYRTEYDAQCSCKQAIEYGTIVINASGTEAAQRASVKFAEQSFPLPIRDPRHRAEPIVTAEIIEVPMPRRRPHREGDPVTTQPVSLQRAEARYGTVGGKKVRIVGPVTPYVQ